jgi:signal transduction histidine kinase
MSQLAEFILVLVGSFSVILTLMSVFFFVLISKYRQNLIKKQNEALNNLIIGQDTERERLSRDLHDEMGPRLSSVLLSIGSIHSPDARISEMVEETKIELKSAIQDIRKISHDLMSLTLVKFGLIAAIEELIDRLKPGAIKVEFESNSNGQEYDDKIKSHLFKITQELIYNSNKYSGASLISINLQIDPEKRFLHYIYTDNGKGNPNYNPADAGIGLKNIKTRVGLMDGQFEVEMKTGFKAEITLNY